MSSAASARQGLRGPRYRRRRPLPALVLLIVLVVVSGFVWTRVLGSTETVEMATRCAPPGATSAGPGSGTSVGTVTPELGRMLPRNALNGTSPIPPQDVQVHVFNSNGQSNQATLISKELSNLGFGKGGEPANDPVYSKLDLDCHAQIRFGSAGAGAARTLSLMAPCAQLVRDQRKSATVDLALGTEFEGIKTTQEAKQVLQQLKNRDGQGDRLSDGGRSSIDRELLSQARDVHC